MGGGVVQVGEDTLHGSEMSAAGGMKVETQLLDGIGEIRLCESGPRAEKARIGAGVRCLLGLSRGGAGIRSRASTATAVAVTATATATAAAVLVLSSTAAGIVGTLLVLWAVEDGAGAAGREKGYAGGVVVAAQIYPLTLDEKECRAGLKEHRGRRLKLEEGRLIQHIVRKPSENVQH
ncbi:unnamed protein product [Cuscuta campestris]|uniref:Uncharacterized protein n=1 Tax=Cuscuta campestris TaxID=132261 RepID=A0A484K7P1_9ASTE|nr:unnamed protein product [Cuscuta campestris]